MHTKTMISAALAAAATTATIGLATAGGQTPSGAPTTLTLGATFDEQSFAVHRTNPKSRRNAAGDVLTFGIALRKDGAPFGRIEAAQIGVDKRYGAVSMHYTLLLSDGTMEVLGAGTNKKVPGVPAPREDDPLTIVGGTGAYAGAHGTFVLREAKGGDTITLTYTR